MTNNNDINNANNIENHASTIFSTIRNAAWAPIEAVLDNVPSNAVKTYSFIVDVGVSYATGNNQQILLQTHTKPLCLVSQMHVMQRHI